MSGRGWGEGGSCCCCKALGFFVGLGRLVKCACGWCRTRARNLFTFRPDVTADCGGETWRMAAAGGPVAGSWVRHHHQITHKRCARRTCLTVLHFSHTSLSCTSAGKPQPTSVPCTASTAALSDTRRKESSIRATRLQSLWLISVITRDSAAQTSKHCSAVACQ